MIPIIDADALSSATVTIGQRVLTLKLTSRGWLRESYDVYDGDIRLSVADPLSVFPTVEVLASYLTPRKMALVNLAAEFNIRANTDHPDPRIYRELESSEQVGRYVAVTRDETHSFLVTCRTLDDALELLSQRAGNDTGGLVVGVYDLDEQKMLHIRTKVTLDPEQF